MRIYPAIHYTMGGLWVDYNLETTIPGLFALGEANFSDHGANRLGASALMQGLSDGYFVIPYTIGNYLAQAKLGKVANDAPEVQEAEQSVENLTNRLLSIKGHRTVDSFHRELGKIMWDECGMSRKAQGSTRQSAHPRIERRVLEQRHRARRRRRAQSIPRKAGRVADFFELGELMCRDAEHRNESCGGHFREEYQTDEGEAKRDDDDFQYAAAWEWTGGNNTPVLHKEPLQFDYVHPSQRSYK